MNQGPDVTDRPSRVLIVDDERQNRQLLEVMLEAEGFVLQMAASGEEALAMVAQQRPDLILLDVVMPGLDGYQVTEKIKGDFATKNIPVILVTARDERNARMLGLNAGAEDFLTKPVDRSELRVRVRNLLRLKAYGDYHDKYSQVLESEVGSRTADLRLERDRAQQYLDTAQIILLALDTEGRITLVNRYACAVLGWTTEELLGRNWIETCLPARMRDELVKRRSDILRGDLSIVENPILTRSGEERLIEWRNTLLRDDAGHVTGTFSSGADITERSQAIEAVRTAEERMRFALESTDIGIWDMDYATGVLRWSTAIEAHYGLEPGTFGGTFEAFVERVHPDDRAALLETVGQAMKSGQDFTIQNRSLWPDGTVRWLTGAGRIKLGTNGEPIRGIGISQDVTERLALDRQYQQAHKMEAVGRLASGVAHDFNNMLTVILGCAELVSGDGDVARRHQEDLREIIKAAKRAAGLTRQLLAFGRQQVLHAAPLDVNGLIINMSGMLDRLIGEHIEVVLTLAPSLPHALADRSQVEQVLMNLVVNARDAMPNGGRVTIHTDVVELENSSFHEAGIVPGHYVMLAITDTGEGMTKETQRHLFEPFFTTKEAGKGTGLGLSTTYGIVKQSNGYVWVYSELGQGTTFKVYLPCSSADVVPEEPGMVTALTKIASATVLLVEDQVAVRNLSKRILENAGYRVLAAENGDDAEKVFAENAASVDLLISDVVMPGCGGPELYARLRVRVPSLKVLYMSGYTEQSTAQSMGIDGGLPFVQKPFTAAELVRKVREALARRSNPSQPLSPVAT